MRCPVPPPAARPGKPPQTIRGGFIVVRRDNRTSRLLTRHGTAYEHGSSVDAKAQASILAEQFGCEFGVFCEVASILPSGAATGQGPEPIPQPETVPDPKSERGP